MGLSDVTPSELEFHPDWIVKIECMNTLPQQTFMSDSAPVSMTQELTALHEAYVAAVNQAVGADDLVLADELAREFDRDARELRAERGGPPRPPEPPQSSKASTTASSMVCFGPVNHFLAESVPPDRQHDAGCRR